MSLRDASVPMTGPGGDGLYPGGRQGFGRGPKAYADIIATSERFILASESGTKPVTVNGYMSTTYYAF